MAIAAAVGLYAAGLGIYSFFSGAQSDVERRFEMNQIKDDLASLKDLSTAVVNSNIAQSLGGSDAALEFLTQYAAADDTADRDAFAREAINVSTLALNEIEAQVRNSKDTASFETLAYSFAALHYAAIARQIVGNTVEDGPLGAAGLHLSVKEAMQLLLDNVGQDDIYHEFGRAISERITTTGLETNFIQTTIDFTVRSSLTGHSESVSLTRESGFNPGPLGIPLPFVESDASFEARANAAANAASNRIYNRDVEALEISSFLNIAGDANQWLALDTINVADLYEYIGTSAGEQIDGTSRADYISGRQGDDILFGEVGPDAINGGAGNDVLRGGSIQDVLTGGPGYDFIFGNETYFDAVDGDTARFVGLSSEYEIVGGQTYAIVTNAEGERDKLFNIEFLRFDDTVITLGEGSALDGAGDPEGFIVAERVALLYEAALNRDGNIDLPGLNFYIDVTEANKLTDEFLARDLVTSPEFTANFGDARTLSNEEFLQQVYQNVLDRDPDLDGFLFYLNLLNDERITKELALADIAISPENTEASGEILMSLFEGSDDGWSFV